LDGQIEHCSSEWKSIRFRTSSWQTSQFQVPASSFELTQLTQLMQLTQLTQTQTSQLWQLT
jgi:hypothetical protein